MRVFENNVQLLKHKVLKEVARSAFQGTLERDLPSIPERIIQGPEAETRCCIYKERAIVNERVKLALGGDGDRKNNIQVIDIACDDCPVDRYKVTDACRGCLAHKCLAACPFGAIRIIDKKAVIDPGLCRECGKCAEACPYGAIGENQRPCMRACKAGAIRIDGETKKASILEEKCVQCGACVYQCPFGAIMDKSQILEVALELGKRRAAPGGYPRMYAVIAPAISSQFTYAKIGQVVEGIGRLGFHSVVEAALGADIVAWEETRGVLSELAHKDFVTTSCCPAFVDHIRKEFPELADRISTVASPMVATARLVKSTDPQARVVFIGPCTAKKAEAAQESLGDAVDHVITFEELQALLDALDIRVEECGEGLLDNASYYGRIFARSGGVTEAVLHVAATLEPGRELAAYACDGLEECGKMLTLGKMGRLPYDFLEGMACKGGCICGPASLSHGKKDKNEVDKYARLSMEEDVAAAVRVFGCLQGK
ncbi:4Fe-4S dicluster domain-containing protein [Anaerotalea alkaliphila]|uniref:4Fe-4S dicluster domain-containing protein n=1 Tax=Anaerotalea alkaliphila TaxID=2662126 RepID=A0A7X5HW95_9FIRM|nr:4Fe-4S dicluster domain-containing protein [Anaerotalea alkaliphila]NDL67815.1 4Fe-4S dicluster domain-containing protein [Anaerotalea alkaliphila]